MRYSGNTVMAMPHSRNESYMHSKRIPYPNEKDGRSGTNKSYPKPSYEEPEKIKIESTVNYNKSEEKKDNVLFSVFGFDVHIDDLILIGLIIVLFISKNKKNANECDDDEKDKDKGFFGLGDDMILLVALGYLLLDSFL